MSDHLSGLLKEKQGMKSITVRVTEADHAVFTQACLDLNLPKTKAISAIFLDGLPGLVAMAKAEKDAKAAKAAEAGEPDSEEADEAPSKDSDEEKGDDDDEELFE